MVGSPVLLSSQEILGKDWPGKRLCSQLSVSSLSPCSWPQWAESLSLCLCIPYVSQLLYSTQEIPVTSVTHCELTMPFALV